MHLHILGISGTFMSALALLARDAGFHVSGSDTHCYPPVTDLLQAKNIAWQEGYEDSSLALKADCVLIGNVMKRGMPVVEAVLNAGKAYYSGPEFLAKHILSSYRVIAVAGTHGKTTTTSMLAFILSEAGLDPGFLIGGVAPNFNTSAHLGKGKWFVIEADEYDSAFFDKRPKLMHYRPELAIIGNLEFDHADIYPNLEAIQQQFHYFLKTIPSKGVLFKPRDDKALNEVTARGVFSHVEDLAFDGEAVWRAEILEERARGSKFCIWHHGEVLAEVHWPLIGKFNMENAMAAIAAASHAGVHPEKAANILTSFQPVKRRLELIHQDKGISIYDDFAHHPTAIKKTIEALKQSKRHKRIMVVLEFASYTMRTGVHADHMAEALKDVDAALLLDTDAFDLATVAKTWSFPTFIFASTEAIVAHIKQNACEGDAILIMSNRGFGNIYHQLKLVV